MNAEELAVTVDTIVAGQGQAVGQVTDVVDPAAFRALAQKAMERFGCIDVLVNNAGIMPLGFFSDHARAAAAWDRCIDVNIKGVLNGILAVHDQLIAQGRGHIVNLSSIYGNFPVAGAAVYGASKAAVNFLSEALRVESQGRIKVTTIRPTGVPLTGLGKGVVNPMAIVGILGQNAGEYLPEMQAFAAGTLPPEKTDPQSPQYVALDPAFLADQILYAIDQPWGVSIGDITVRATGDRYIL